MYSYSVMCLDKEHIEDYCRDIKAQVKDGVCIMPLFSMTLTPEGAPAIDKAALLCGTYREYKARLSQKGIPSGVLIQASIGHGWKLNQPSSFQKYVGLLDGEEREVCCPLDKNFQAYIRASAKTIASEHPDHIMLDDDFRLMARPQLGCACKLHLARFNQTLGIEITREQLLAAMKEESELSDRYKEIFSKTQIDSLLECAKEIRAGIDEVDPTISGSFCACGSAAEGAYEIAKIMAGKGNPVVLRVNNSNYCARDHRNFSHIMNRLSTQLNCLSGKPDILLAETDTCPQNRYSTPAVKLHAHFTFSILEGAKGAKHWITRLVDFEQRSGDAYRKKLSQNCGFYNELIHLTERATPLGCKVPMSKRPLYSIYKLGQGPHGSSTETWTSRVLDRLGIPFHFTASGKGVLLFDKSRVDRFTDSELLEMLSCNVMLDAPAAKRLIDRGFGAYLGVDVKERGAGAKNASGEIVFSSGKKTKALYRVHEIIPLCDSVKEHSEVFFLKDGVERERLFPGVTTYQNSLGGTMIVFSGDTDFELNLTDAFGFLNETRKAQILHVLTQLGEIPAYYPDDAEVMLRTAELDSGELMIAFLDMSLDAIESIPLVIHRPVSEIRRLMPDGSYRSLGFSADKNRYELSLSAQVFDPVILIVK